jgi:hypothetical protein
VPDIPAKFFHRSDDGAIVSENSAPAIFVLHVLPDGPPDGPGICIDVLVDSRDEDGGTDEKDKNGSNNAGRDERENAFK